MDQKIIVQLNNYLTQEVGVLRPEIVTLLDIVVNEPSIVLYPGTIGHIKRRHYRAYRQYLTKIPDIIANPDYVGMSVSEERCIELVKKYDEYIMVAIKWDQNDRLFISSMYMMDDDRIDNRVAYGKLIEAPKPKKKKLQKYKNKCRKRR
ncbi:MAG: PBECR2 nuclease fold domain-containing protein [Cellulosilyticaceae bacterium]